MKARPGPWCHKFYPHCRTFFQGASGRLRSMKRLSIDPRLAPSPMAPPLAVLDGEWVSYVRAKLPISAASDVQGQPSPQFSGRA